MDVLQAAVQHGSIHWLMMNKQSGGTGEGRDVGCVILVKPSKVSPHCSLFHCCESCKERRMRAIGTDCFRRHITDKIQLHVTDTTQRLQHSESAAHLPFLSVLLFSLCLKQSCEMAYGINATYQIW